MWVGTADNYQGEGDMARNASCRWQADIGGQIVVKKIGKTEFVDGTTRDVYQDTDGQEYVIGNEGEKVHGVWLVPADEPVKK